MCILTEIRTQTNVQNGDMHGDIHTDRKQRICNFDLLQSELVLKVDMAVQLHAFSFCCLTATRGSVTF